jgi:rod shape-determining protein MreD
MEVFWQRLDNWLRVSMPASTAFAMALLSVMAWPLPYLGAVMPPLAFVALYYWGTHRPDLFPVGAAFALGLVNDVIQGLPIGVSAFLFTIAHHIFSHQRRFFAGQSFSMLWYGFALSAIAMMIAQWILVSVIDWHAIPLFPILLQTLLAVVLFPLPCWILIRLQRACLSNM